MKPLEQNLNMHMICAKYDGIMETREWVDKIPFLKFPSDWQVKIIPPFGGAVVRFQIMYNNRAVSVYLDCYDKLGCMGEPYWEVYPYVEDVFRCLMNETDELLTAIAESLNYHQFDEAIIIKPEAIESGKDDANKND